MFQERLVEGQRIITSCEIRWNKHGMYYRMPEGKTGTLVGVTKSRVKIEWDNCPERWWFPIGDDLEEAINFI